MASPSPSSDVVDSSCAGSSVEVHAALLRAHLWIVHAQMSGLIADSLWERLPGAWHAPLLALSDEETARLPTDLPLPQDWPQDLAFLVQSGRAASAVVTPAVPPVAAAEVSPCLLCHTKNVRNMGPKKQHEVLRLAPLIASVARRCGASAVIDVGSGMGCAPLPQTPTRPSHGRRARTLAPHAHPTPHTLHPAPYIAPAAPKRRPSCADLSHVLALRRPVARAHPHPHPTPSSSSQPSPSPSPSPQPSPDLSHVLALHYGLRVVGIDSEESNTKGAQVRSIAPG